MDAVRLGTAGRDEQISWLHDQIRAMGELGIGTLCYNWHAVTGWARTHHDVPLRGGARSGGYGYATLGRLFAVGYITGLRDATYGLPPARYGRQVGEDALR